MLRTTESPVETRQVILMWAKINDNAPTPTGDLAKVDFSIEINQYRFDRWKLLFYYVLIYMYMIPSKAECFLSLLNIYISFL